MYIPTSSDADVYNLSKITHEFLCMLDTDQEAGEKLLIDFIGNMHTLRMLDSVDLGYGFQEMFNHYDYRYGLIADIAYKNMIFATTGNHNLTGTNSNDAFITGTGNNTLNGGNGDDTYFFNINSGVNTIINSGGDNIIILSGLEQDDMTINRLLNSNKKLNIEITFNNCKGKIIIQDYFYEEAYTLVFPDSSYIELVDYFPVTEIRTIEELKNIGNDLHGIYQLMSDIDLVDTEWTPIGTSASYFYGSFDGNGHKISNLNISLQEQDHVGLFGINSGQILNLSLENVTISGKSFVGSFVGTNKGKITNCSASGGSGVRGLSYVGGFSGTNNGVIEKSYTTLDVYAKDYAGGFTGTADNSKIDRCYAMGNVDCNVANTSYSRCGGFTASIISSTVSNCFSTGNVAGKYMGETAGFIYSASSSTVENCYSKSSNPYGFIKSGTAKNCYFDKDLINSGTVNHMGRTAAEMRSESTFIDWDFTDIWEMGSSGYPVLQDMEMPTINFEIQTLEYASLTVINASDMPLEILSERQNYKSYLIGEMVTLKVLPTEKWIFVEWQNENGETVSKDDEYSFIIKGDITLILICELDSQNDNKNDNKENYIKDNLEDNTKNDIEEDIKNDMGDNTKDDIGEDISEDINDDILDNIMEDIEEISV